MPKIEYLIQILSVVIDIIEDDSGSSTTDDVCIAQVQELRTDDSKDTEVTTKCFSNVSRSSVTKRQVRFMF